MIWKIFSLYKQIVGEISLHTKNFIVIYSNCMYAMSTIDWVLNKCDKLNNNFDIELLKLTKTLNKMLCFPNTIKNFVYIPRRVQKAHIQLFSFKYEHTKYCTS